MHTNIVRKFSDFDLLCRLNQGRLKMLSETNFDKFKLLNLLAVHPELREFRHGQLRIAASRMIKEYGYQWAITRKGETIEETNRLIRLSREMRSTVFQATEGWHSNKSVVWKRFREYTKRVGLRCESRRIIEEIRKNSGSNSI